MGKSSNLVVRLSASFQQYQDRTAIVDHGGERTTTYGRLLETALRVTAYLESKHYAPHSFIAIALPAGMEYVAAELGIWMAGHTFVPLGNHFPQERIDYILAHCEAPLLIDETVMAAMLSTPPATHYSLPDDDDIALLIYTSGSTGHPKGMMHDFRSYDISPFITDTLQTVSPLRMGATSPMYFIVSKYIYGVLLVGGVVDIIPDDVIRDISEFEQYVAAHQISYLFSTPSLLRHFHSQSSSLKLVMLIGERVSRMSPDGYVLMNIYGMTETSGGCMMFNVDKAYDNTPIGKPYFPMEFKIVDEDDHEVSQGESGELCLRGPFTTGYYKEPELTAQCFRDGWLHTGDMVRQLTDGNLLYVNRKDWMMKINGQRVEPGEVEAVIRKMDGVTDVVVKGFDTGDRQFLCAYYMAQPGITEPVLRRLLSSALPEYMVPSYFIRMDHFALNVNGKVDRQQLPSPLERGTSVGQQPCNKMESFLCDVFAEVLGFPTVGPDDDFFALGGDSISVMSLQARCPDLPLTARIIYENGTPRLIAQACREMVAQAYPSLPDYPLTQSQLGIYLECMSRPGEIAYNNGMLFRLDTSVDVRQLAIAFEKVIAAHPFVKTRLFINAEGVPRQRRNDSDPFSLEVETMSEVQFEALKPQLMQPFQLLRDRLFRIRIIKTPKDSYLFMDFHHTIFDGTSLGILLTDLSRAYRHERIDKEVFSGYEMALEEERLRNSPSYTNAKDWYMKLFGSLEVNSLPLPDKSEKSTTFGRQELVMSVDERQLLDACHRLDVTPNVLTTTVMGCVLGAYTYASESLFATVYHGRQDLKVNHSVAMLVKTLPVYMKWDAETTIGGLLHATKQQLLGSMGNDLFSFAELKALNHHINSQILFAYQGDLDAYDIIGNMPFSQIPLMENATGEALAFEVTRRDGRFILSAEYQGNLYSSSFIERLMRSYDQLVSGFVMASDGRMSVRELSLLTPEDQQALLKIGTGESLVYDTTETFVTMFRRQAALTPELTAVVDECSEITYAELDRQSDILASSLVKAGVTEDTFVALLLPRRKEFLVAVLAVFKAGGAYVSLDSETPRKRLDFMLGDLDARYIITTSSLMTAVDTGRFTGGGLILLDQFDFSVNVLPTDFSRPQSLAYVIFTSGTSGEPKGVLVEHRALCSMLEWVVPMEELKTGDRCGHHASFSFDASIVDLFAPLTCGAEVHLLSSALRYDLEAVSNYLKEHDIAGLTMSTQVGMELLDSFDPKLRYLFMGGEKLHPVRETSVRQINGYGPTEFTVCSSYHVVDQNRNYDNIPIGRPVPNSTSVVVGPMGNLVPWGAVGELCLMGTQMARGYWQRERQTREKFVDCTFCPGKKMYHTGDLVQWNSDGELMFIGRIDNQIKLRGYRIELGEIESRMNDYPGVQASAVILSTQNRTQYLTAYYTAENPIPPETLRDNLASVLPGYMVPLKLIQLDKMPMTMNGKIDRRRLEENASSQPFVTRQIEPPVGLRETLLCQLVVKLLGTEMIGVNDDLTLLGLSSLDAIRLASMASKKGMVLKVNDIMHGKTIRKIAQQEAAIGRWQDGYHADKPVVVAIQGFSPYQVHQYFDALCERFSVFTFTSLDDYLSDDSSIVTKSDVVTRYLAELEKVLPAGTKPIAFVGHCYGGELAYRCAVQWQAKTGQTAKVVLLNTPHRTEEEIRQMMPSQSVIDQMSDEQLQRFESWRQQHEVVVSLIDGVPMPPYQGEVIYYKATLPYQEANKIFFDSEGLARLDVIYEQRWRSHVPNLTVIPVPANHFSMIEAQYINLYLDRI